ncbi:MAG: SMI1/KNR4 family protein [Cognaticolwellia sp.]
MNNIDDVVKSWGSNQNMTPIASDDIATLEAKLGVQLPDTYKYLLSTYGLVRTPNVLSKVCDLSVEIAQVQDFLSLDDVASLSQLYEMTGMPNGHILFASDCQGNMFCFKASECVSNNKDIAVWLYEHDLRTVVKVANTFSKWLGQFSKL